MPEAFIKIPCAFGKDSSAMRKISVRTGSLFDFFCFAGDREVAVDRNHADFIELVGLEPSQDDKVLAELVSAVFV